MVGPPAVGGICSDSKVENLDPPLGNAPLDKVLDQQPPNRIPAPLLVIGANEVVKAPTKHQTPMSSDDPTVDPQTRDMHLSVRERRRRQHLIKAEVSGFGEPIARQKRTEHLQ